MNEEQRRLASALKKQFRYIRPCRFRGWQDPAINVLDCVLSLNRRYDEFVMPRLETFGDHHPETVGLSGLRRMIRRYRSPGAFSVAELNYNHDARADIVLGVTEYLLVAQRGYKGRTEAARLRGWAKSVRPPDLKSVAIHGFGLAGFQYLRMLFGANTVKPDRHILKFVAKTIGRRVSAIDALRLLEDASREVGFPIRNVDYALWEAAARRARLCSAP